MLDGFKAWRRWLAAGGAGLIYSGGIGSLEHRDCSGGRELHGLAGAIVGMALYEGRFTVAEGQAALDAATSGMSGQAVEIRDAADADVAAIREIFNQVIATTTAVWRDGPVDLSEPAVGGSPSEPATAIR